MKLGILLHLGNHELWSEFKNYIKKLFLKTDCFLVVNLVKQLNSKNKIDKQIKIIKNDFPKVIITKSDNKGMDIGGFFTQLMYLKNNKIKYDWILKLHTKTDKKWRNQLMLPILNNFDQCLKDFKNDKIGMIGSKKWALEMDNCNSPLIIDLLKKYGIENCYFDEIDWKLREIKKKDLNFLDPFFYVKYNNIKIPERIKLYNKYNKDVMKFFGELIWYKYGSKTNYQIQHPSLIIKKKKKKNIKFIGGTIFLINKEVTGKIIQIISDNNIKLISGYKLNTKPTITHSWERLFSIFVDDYYLKLKLI